jgi:hypothetical protein
MSNFQTAVRSYLAPLKKGGWASANPYVTMVPPNNGDLGAANSASWRVGASGAILGQFAFADAVSGSVTNAHPGTGPTMLEGPNPAAGTVRVGFVHIDQISLITAYLGGDTMQALPGQGISLLTRGDVGALFASGATVGQFVFASYADGSAIAQNSTTAPTASVAVTTANTSTALTGVGAGAYAGQPISGTGIPAGAYLVSVNPTAGTAVLSAAATATGSITATVSTAAYTGWRVDSVAAAGDISKISVWG